MSENLDDLLIGYQIDEFIPYEDDSIYIPLVQLVGHQSPKLDD